MAPYRAVLLAGVLLLAGCVTDPPTRPTAEAPATPSPEAPTPPTSAPAGKSALAIVALGNTTAATRTGATDVYAYPGFVTILVDGTAKAADLEGVATAHGGRLLAGAPAGGIVEAFVPPERQTAAMERWERTQGVVAAFPSVAAQPAQATHVEDGVFPLATQADVTLIDDAWTPQDPPPVCGGATHAQMTQAVAGEAGETTQVLDVKRHEASIPLTIHRVAEGSTAGPKVISISMQGGEPEELQGNVDRRACTSADCVRHRASQVLFLDGVFHAVQHTPRRDDVMVVLSAGNYGFDLTSTLANLKARYPQAAERILLVGGTTPGGEPDTTFNTASDPAQMVFAQGRGVSVTVAGASCAVDGTSFAAPQVARLAAQLHKRQPSLNATQLAHVIRAAAYARDHNATGGLAQGWSLVPDLARAATVADILYGKGRLAPTNATNASANATRPPTPPPAPPPPPPSFRPYDLPTATRYVPFNGGYRLCDPQPPEGATTCNSSATLSSGTPPYRFRLGNESALPAGLTLHANGSVLGTPTEVARRNVTICVVDAREQTACREMLVQVLRDPEGAILSATCALESSTPHVQENRNVNPPQSWTSTTYKYRITASGTASGPESGSADPRLRTTNPGISPANWTGGTWDHGSATWFRRAGQPEDTTWQMQWVRTVYADSRYPGMLFDAFSSSGQGGQPSSTVLAFKVNLTVTGGSLRLSSESAGTC